MSPASTMSTAVPTPVLRGGIDRLDGFLDFGGGGAGVAESFERLVQQDVTLFPACGVDFTAKLVQHLQRLFPLLVGGTTVGA